MSSNWCPLLQTLEDLLRSPPSYPEGLVGRNVSLTAGDEASRAANAATNESFPIFGGGSGYNTAEEGGAAATANATQTTDCEQVGGTCNCKLITMIK